MDAIKPNSILNFNENQMHNVRNALGYGDVNKLKQDIEHLQDWIQSRTILELKNLLLTVQQWTANLNRFASQQCEAIIYEEYLERWLIYNKGSIERTKQRFDRLCTCTNLMPEFLQNFDIKNEFHHLFVIQHTCVLQKPTDDNFRVLITYVTGKEDSDFKLIDYYRYLIVLGHYMLCNDYCHGYEFIADSRNITMGIISKINPIIIHKAMALITEAMGQRMKKLHFISGSKFFDTVLMLFKQGVSTKLRDRIIVHSDLESLHKYIPRERLPKDLGGDEKSMAELADINFQALSSDDHIAKVKFMEDAATDESCRLPGKFNEEYSGMPGSFKTLCVD